MPGKITPAPEVQSVTSYPTPQLLDRHLLVRVSTLEPDYTPVEPGTPHPDSRNFPGYFLLKEMPIDPSNPSWVWRVYGNGYEGQDVYAYETKYGEGDIEYPTYARTYLELRSAQGDTWPLDKLQPFSGVFDARVINGGSNYDQASVTATVAGTGSGCDILPIVTDGAITHLIIRNPGTGYTGTPTITFGGGGFGATAVLLIQPENCLLTVEEQVRADETNDWMYVKVRRLYETLPGPLIEEYHFDVESGTERTHYRQRVAIGTLADPVAAFKITSAVAGSPPTITTDLEHGFTTGDVVLIQGIPVTLSNVNGNHTITVTGVDSFTLDSVVSAGTSPNNTGYVSPVLTNALNSDQVVIDSVVKPDDSAGTVTGTLLTTTALLPGREMSAPDYDTERAAYVDSIVQAVPYGWVAPAEGSTLYGKIVEGVDFNKVNAAMMMLTTKTILLPGDDVETLSFDEATGVVRTTIKTRVAIGSSADTIGGAPTPTSPGPYVTQSKVVEENSVVGVKITEKMELPDGWTETVSGSEPMPSIFTFIGPWLLGDTGFMFNGPFADVPGGTFFPYGPGNYSIERHGVASPLICTHSFTWGVDNTIFSTFSVVSGRSRFMPLDGMTLHPAYTLTETNPDSETQLIEAMFESVPAPGFYQTGYPVVVNVTNEPYEGGPNGIWLRKTYTAIMT